MRFLVLIDQPPKIVRQVRKNDFFAVSKYIQAKIPEKRENFSSSSKKYFLKHSQRLVNNTGNCNVHCGASCKTCENESKIPMMGQNY